MHEHGRGPSPIRVVRIITRLNIGGPSIQAIDLTSGLTSRGYETVLVHGTPASREGDMRYLFAERPAGGHRTIELPFLRRPLAPVDDLRSIGRIVALLRRYRPSIVHTHMAKAGTVGRLAAAAYNNTIGRRHRVRVVHTYHGHVLDGYFGPLKTKAFIGIERGLAAATDRIVAISPRIRDELADEYAIGKPAQYSIVRLGFHLDAFTRIDDANRADARRSAHLDASAPVVTTVGRLTAIKHQTLFLEVAKIVAATHPSATFLIVGDGELRPGLERAARDMGLEEHVRFLGWRRDLPAIYAATDVFLLTSRNEGTPVALIEAMASGCAVVSTDVGGVRDVIVDEKVGSVSPFGDVDSLAAHVSDLLRDRDRRVEMGAAGRKLAAARFGIERLITDIDRLYRDVLA